MERKLLSTRAREPARRGEAAILEAGTPEGLEEFQSAARGLGLGLGESDAMIACRKARRQPESSASAARSRTALST